MNGDGKITATDARLAMRAASQLEILTEAEKYAAYINGDGKITAADSRIILNKSNALTTNISVLNGGAIGFIISYFI